MQNGMVICDSGPVFSLAVIDKLEILNLLFDQIYIPFAVWEEITRDESQPHYERISSFFEDKRREISGFNELTFVMDYGESEAVMLYKELNADYLLVDDKKARKIAENFGIKCIGTIGILAIGKDKGLIEELKTIIQRIYTPKTFLFTAITKQHIEKI